MENSFISVSSDSDSEIILERKPAKKPEIEILSDEDSTSTDKEPSQSPEVVGLTNGVEIVSANLKKENQQPLSSSTKPQKPILIDAPSNPEMYNRLVSIDPEKRLYGGKMTDQRMNKVHQITGDVIAAIHSAATQAPINVPTECDGLLIDLMPHQKSALTWMLWREKQLKGPGGILGDDMGLGKTLSMIALILHSKNERIKAEKTSKAELLEDNKRPLFMQDNSKRAVSSNTTLVIAPASLIYQWEKEVTDRVKENRLRVHIFHGPKNKREISAKRLSQFDIVITTYQTVSSELSEKFKIDEDFAALDSSSNSPFQKKVRNGGDIPAKKYVSVTSGSVLTKVIWERIILDEAHQIKNRLSLVSKSCCKLNAGARWCLTGTPIHNELWDLFSLIRFLKVTPFGEEKVWKESIMSASKSNADRLNCLVKGLLLRRTKNQICEVTNKPIVDLKPRLYELVELTLQEPEDRCYQVMFDASRQKVRDLLKNQEDVANYGFPRSNKNKQAEKVKNPFLMGMREIRNGDKFQQMSCVLVLLLRLRQACTHFGLLKHAVDMNAFKEDAGEVGAGLDKLEESMAQMSLDEEQLLNQIEDADGTKIDAEKIFEPNYQSTKVSAVLERMGKIAEAGDKCVIVSQWSSMLSIIEIHLKKRNVNFTSITGAIQTKDRQERVDSFNLKNGGAQVMLLSLTAGGVGLNLIGGNHLFILDLHWCVIFDGILHLRNRHVTEFTVWQLQETKTALAKSVLEGAAKMPKSKLTVNELKFLFELEKKPVSQKAPPAPKPASQNEPYIQSGSVVVLPDNHMHAGVEPKNPSQKFTTGFGFSSALTGFKQNPPFIP